MSIEASYRRVTPKQFAKLQDDPKAAASFLGTDFDDLDLENLDALLDKIQEQKNNDRYLGIGRDWHVLHFLLTGDSNLDPHLLPPPPLGNVVKGGTETEWDCTYGKVRSLSPAEVRAAANALAKISLAELRSRFSVSSFNAAEIYPHGRRTSWTKEDAETAFEIYPQLVEFFGAAARAGDMLLLSSD